MHNKRIKSDCQKAVHFGSRLSASFDGCKKMTIAFKTKYNDCADAIDGEILQITFDSVTESQDWKHRKDPFLLIGQNFKIPGLPAIEWHDGNDYDGKAEVQKLSLSQTNLNIDTDRDIDFSLTLFVLDKEFPLLSDFLKRIFGNSDIHNIS